MRQRDKSQYSRSAIVNTKENTSEFNYLAKNIKNNITRTLVPINLHIKIYYLQQEILKKKI